MKDAGVAGAELLQENTEMVRRMRISTEVILILFGSNFAGFGSKLLCLEALLPMMSLILW